MSIHRKNAKRDTAETEIIAALEAVGAKVYQISGQGIPDLLVTHHGAIYLMEVKTGKRGKLTPAQLKFFEENVDCDDIGIVRTVEDALSMLGLV